MCSRSENDAGDELMTSNDAHNFRGSLCRKCNDSAAKVVLQSKFPYCRDCFISAVTHKYRSTLGKSKLMKHGDRVLVAYSGSSSSTCLVHMIQMALDDPKKKKIKTEILILFIDDTLPNIVETNERVLILGEIRESLKMYDFDKYQSALDFVFEERCPVLPLSSEDSPGPNVRSQTMLSDCKSSTSAHDLLRKLRHHLLYLAAKTLNCNKVFLAETSDHLAISIISNVALGRGGQLPFDVGFKDNRYKEVDFLRPLQECSKKEIAFYNSFCNLRPVVVPSVTTKMGKFNSIQKLTEDFITNLAVSFPSTVHTVVATGSKMVVNEDRVCGVCSLCKGIVHATKDSLSSLKATTVSSHVSMLGPNGFDSESLQPKSPCLSTCSQNESCCRASGKTSDVPVSLCYGCQLIVKDFMVMDNWPLPIRRSIEDESQFVAMHQEIKDFLL